MVIFYYSLHEHTIEGRRGKCDKPTNLLIVQLLNEINT